jgi:hypothetical protein
MLMFQRRTSSVVIVDLIPLFRWTNLVLGGQLGGHVEADINTKNVSVLIAYCPSFVSRQFTYCPMDLDPQVYYCN